jgi:hypothetical protein
MSTYLDTIHQKSAKVQILPKCQPVPRELPVGAHCNRWLSAHFLKIEMQLHISHLSKHELVEEATTMLRGKKRQRELDGH